MPARAEIQANAPLAGRFAMVDIPGKRLDAETADFLRRHALRAVCLFRDNLGSEDDIRALTHDLRSVLGPGGLIAIDQEGGSVQRANSLPGAPSAMALGAADDPTLCTAVGAAVARGLAHLGINWNFAPVLDLCNNPDNAVIGARSFGAEPKRVAALAQAWMRGAMDAGVACCVKHFPGHGDTHTDSHLDLPRVSKARAALDALELAPFRALADTAPAVMSAHIVYDALDPTRPATLSAPILGGLLRDAWRYPGVIITDALNMQAITRHYGNGMNEDSASALALKAGADMVMILGARAEQQAALAGIDAAIRAGHLDTHALAASTRRLDDLAARFPLACRDYTAPQRADDEALMQRAWAAGLHAGPGATVPARTTPLRVVYARAASGDGVSDAGLDEAQVRALFDDFADVFFCPVTDLATLDWDTLPEAQRTSVLVSTTRSRYGDIARRWRPDLHILLWNPFAARDVAAPALIAWGFAPGARAAVRAWLGGSLAATGKAPVAADRATGRRAD